MQGKIPSKLGIKKSIIQPIHVQTNKIMSLIKCSDNFPLYDVLVCTKSRHGTMVTDGLTHFLSNGYQMRGAQVLIDTRNTEKKNHTFKRQLCRK